MSFRNKRISSNEPALLIVRFDIQQIIMIFSHQLSNHALPQIEKLIYSNELDMIKIYQSLHRHQHNPCYKTGF